MDGWLQLDFTESLADMRFTVCVCVLMTQHLRRVVLCVRHTFLRGSFMFLVRVEVNDQ